MLLAITQSVTHSVVLLNHYWAVIVCLLRLPLKQPVYSHLWDKSGHSLAPQRRIGQPPHLEWQYPRVRSSGTTTCFNEKANFLKRFLHNILKGILKITKK